jgi:hypothetical protein
MRRIAFLLVLLVLIGSVSGEQNDCEKLAKDYQALYGGDLILVQPLKENGAYDLGAYNGHWMNRAWNKQIGNYYYDSETNSIFISKSEVLEWYEFYNKKSVIFNYNQGEVPFALIWHY